MLFCFVIPVPGPKYNGKSGNEVLSQSSKDDESLNPEFIWTFYN